MMASQLRPPEQGAWQRGCGTLPCHSSKPHLPTSANWPSPPPPHQTGRGSSARGCPTARTGSGTSRRTAGGRWSTLWDTGLGGSGGCQCWPRPMAPPGGCAYCRQPCTLPCLPTQRQLICGAWLRLVTTNSHCMICHHLQVQGFMGAICARNACAAKVGRWDTFSAAGGDVARPGAALVPASP